MIDLNGIWYFSKDGESEIEINVPGCWENIIEEKDFAGPSYLRRKFDLNIEDSGDQWIICFGGVSYYCEVYLNGKYVGSHEGIWDRFVFNVTGHAAEGENELKLVVWKPGYKSDDRFKVREVLSGFIPDVCSTFGGIWDDVRLVNVPAIFVHSHWAELDADGRGAVLKVKLQNFKDYDIDTELCWLIFDADGGVCGDTSLKATISPGKEELVTGSCPINNIIRWDMDNPYLYSYRLVVKGAGLDEEYRKRFAMRQITADGSKILLNGRPIYIRGILHWGYYDDEIIPNPSREAIMDEILKSKEFGFNMIKHCLYIPREEYFELADALGILQWVELPLWLPDITSELAGRMEYEYPKIIEQISGFGSIVLCSLGCELDAGVDAGVLEKMYHLVKMNGGGMLVRDNSGSGECYGGLSVDFADFFDYHFYGDIHNMEHLMETFTAPWREKRPWLYGEFCDSDTLRDLQRVRKQKGVEKLWWELNNTSLNPISGLKPDFRSHLHDDRMNKYGIREDFETLYNISLEHSIVHRKMTIELTRSFPQIAGYNITSFRDVPIATAGIFDDLMHPKFDPSEFTSFNNDVVLSPAWDLTRVWINADRVRYKERFNFFSGEYYGLHAIISNYSAKAFENPCVSWEITDHGQIISCWQGIVNKTINPGDVCELVYVNTYLPKVSKALSLKLNVKMSSGDRVVENCWPLWVLPETRCDASICLYDTIGAFSHISKIYDVKLLEDCQVPFGCDVVVTSRMTPPILEYLENGGKVFLLQRGEGWMKVRKAAFWREGIIREYNHEILDGMGKNVYNDLKYFSLSTDTVIDTFGMEGIKASPLIRRYDCREFEAADYMVEAEIGNGRLIATTLRFEGGMGKQPNFMKYSPLSCYLFDRIISYLNNK